MSCFKEAESKETTDLAGHLAERLADLLLLCHVLGHPLLVSTQLIVSFDLQELHLLFAPVSFTLQPHELQHRKKTFISV